MLPISESKEDDSSKLFGVEWVKVNHLSKSLISILKKNREKRKKEKLNN